MPTCPLCRHDNPPDAVVCEHCTRYRFPALEVSPDALTLPCSDVAPHVPRFGRPPLALDSSSPSTLPATTSDPYTPAPSTPRLVVVRGQRPGHEFPLINGVNVIGRSGDAPADIDLTGLEPADQIWSSRKHAVVQKDHDLLSIEDAKSLNGTFLNRHKLQPGKRYHLKHGDVIQIGTVQLRVVV
jgi:hypothetical protein